jgi:hypothetical protein
MLSFIAAGGFEPRDSSWVPTVLETVRQLSALDVDDAIEIEIGSLAAVALSATSSTLSPLITTAHHSRQRYTEGEVSHLLVGAEADRIAHYASDLSERFGAAMRVSAILQFAERVVNASPFDDAIEEMRRAGFEPGQNEHQLEITEDVASPIGSALAAISRCRAVNTVSVRCRSTDSWALVAWSQPYLLLLQPGTKGRTWGAVYRLFGIGLGALHAGEIREVSDREVELFTPLDEPGTIAASILETTGWNRDGHSTLPPSTAGQPAPPPARQPNTP